METKSAKKRAQRKETLQKFQDAYSSDPFLYFTALPNSQMPCVIEKHKELIQQMSGDPDRHFVISQEKHDYLTTKNHFVARAVQEFFDTFCIASQYKIQEEEKRETKKKTRRSLFRCFYCHQERDRKNPAICPKGAKYHPGSLMRKNFTFRWTCCKLEEQSPATVKHMIPPWIAAIKYPNIQGCQADSCRSAKYEAEVQKMRNDWLAYPHDRRFNIYKSDDENENENEEEDETGILNHSRRAGA